MLLFGSMPNATSVVFNGSSSDTVTYNGSVVWRKQIAQSHVTIGPRFIIQGPIYEQATYNMPGVSSDWLGSFPYPTVPSDEYSLNCYSSYYVTVPAGTFTPTSKTLSYNLRLNVTLIPGMGANAASIDFKNCTLIYDDGAKFTDVTLSGYLTIESGVATLHSPFEAGLLSLQFLSIGPFVDGRLIYA